MNKAQEGASKRVTVMLSSSNDKLLHELQSKQIKTRNETVSFSNVLNQAVAKGLKHL